MNPIKFLYAKLKNFIGFGCYLSIKFKANWALNHIYELIEGIQKNNRISDCASSTTIAILHLNITVFIGKFFSCLSD